MGKFRIGDKVIVAAHKDEMECPYVMGIKDPFNLTGIICSIHFTYGDGSTSYGIEFEENIGGHNCNGKCKDGYGQNINEKYLKLYDEKKSEDKIMQKKKYEKKLLEQQIKEKYESKRNILNAKMDLQVDTNKL